MGTTQMKTPQDEGTPVPTNESPPPQLSTLSVHGGEARQKPGDSITDPIFCASTYTFENTQSIIDFIEEDQPREEYGRYGNPGERVAERKLAALEGGEMAILYSSGMAAFVGLLMTKLSAGDEVIFFDECYHRSREFCSKHMARFGVKTIQVKACDYDAMEAAITPKTRLLVSESPTNPHLSIVDLDRFAQIGADKGVETLIDATLATPFNLRPLAAGVDYVLHSVTKYLAGHNDLLAGVVIGSAEKLEPVRKLRGIMGAVNGPQNCYLLSRGLKTFELRMQRHNENGQRVAEFLERPSPHREGVLPRAGVARVSRGGPADDARVRRAGDIFGEGCRLAGDGQHRGRGAHSADCTELGRRRIADRAAARDELLPMHARRPPHVWHSG